MISALFAKRPVSVASDIFRRQTAHNLFKGVDKGLIAVETHRQTCIDGTQLGKQGKGLQNAFSGQILGNGNVESGFENSGQILSAVEEMLCNFIDGVDSVIMAIDILLDLGGMIPGGHTGEGL
jgi:hypothetical protein